MSMKKECVFDMLLEESEKKYGFVPMIILSSSFVYEEVCHRHFVASDTSYSYCYISCKT